MSYRIVLIRHGESEWNKANLFTGWTDVDLSDAGREEAKNGGRLLKEEGISFDVCFTSVLKRAIHTANLVLDEMDEIYIPQIKSWKLNERHYGALQGLNKSETAEKYGEDQVKIWRRSFDVKALRGGGGVGFGGLFGGKNRVAQRRERAAHEALVLQRIGKLAHEAVDLVLKHVRRFRGALCQQRFFADGVENHAADAADIRELHIERRPERVHAGGRQPDHRFCAAGVLRAERCGHRAAH